MKGKRSIFFQPVVEKLSFIFYWFPLKLYTNKIGNKWWTLFNDIRNQKQYTLKIESECLPKSEHDLNAKISKSLELMTMTQFTTSRVLAIQYPLYMNVWKLQNYGFTNATTHILISFFNRSLSVQCTIFVFFSFLFLFY